MTEGFIKKEQRAEYKKEILQEFKSVTNFYRLESSGDLLELFHTIGYLLINGMTGRREIRDLLYGDRIVYLADEEWKRIQYCFRQEECECWQQILQNDEVLARTVQEIGRYEVPGGLSDSVWRQILHILQNLLEKYREISDLDFLYEVAREMLELCVNAKGDSGRYALPDSIVFQMAKLIRNEQADNITEKNGRVLDPQYGSGSMLLAAGTYLEDARLCGYEQNERLRMAARILSVLARRPIEMYKGDFLQDRELGTFEVVFANPTFGSEKVPEYVWDWFLPGELGRVGGRHNLVLVRSLQALAENGHAVLVVPDSFLFSSKAETMQVRKWMLQQYCVEGIISLPPKTFYPNTMTRASILIISNPFMRVGWIDGGTPFLFFYQLNVDADSEQMDTELSGIWNQREYYFEQWKRQSFYRNLANIPMPEKWEHSTFWFADPETVEQEKWNMQPKHYQPTERAEFQAENPQILLQELMREQEELLEEMRRLAGEVGDL